MNILNDVNAFLLTKITPYSIIYLDFFPEDPENNSEEIMASNDPSTAVEWRDLTGARSGSFNFAYYAKSKDSEKARLQLEDIINALDFSELTEITGGTAIKIEAVTTPMRVSKSDAQVVIFTASLKLEYYKEA